MQTLYNRENVIANDLIERKRPTVMVLTVHHLESYHTDLGHLVEFGS